MDATTFALEQLALFNSYLEDGEEPFENLRQVAEYYRNAGERELADHFFELNTQNNQAKHDFRKNFKCETERLK